MPMSLGVGGRGSPVISIQCITWLLLTHYTLRSFVIRVGYLRNKQDLGVFFPEFCYDLKTEPAVFNKSFIY